MEYTRHRPSAPLAGFVDYLWLLRDAPAHTKESIVPSGTMELVLNLVADEICVFGASNTERSDRHAGAVVSGAFERPFAVDTRAHATMIGVHFRPGGAAAFFSTPADQLQGRHVALADLWPAGAAQRLREQLCTASHDALRFALLEDALLAQWRPRLAAQQLVQLALTALQHPSRTVQDVVSTLGTSHRRFVQKFAEEVGLTPKLFTRLQRFQRVLAVLERDRTPHWSRLAQRCGYYDQAHLIRDFHAFAGLTPARYVCCQSERVKEHHILLP